MVFKGKAVRIEPFNKWVVYFDRKPNRKIKTNERRY